MNERGVVEVGSAAEGSFFGRVVRVALAAVLASYVCVPSATAFADEPSESTAASEQEASRDDTSDGDASANETGEASEANEPNETGETGEVDNAGEADDTNEPNEPNETGEPSEPSEPSDPAAPDSAPTDLASSWQDGTARIDQPGDYVLGSDVKAESPLVVALPEGAVATLDLAGHDVTIENAPAAIDLASNEGEITFTDSKHDDTQPDRRVAIELKADDPEAAVAAVSAVRAPGTRDADPKAIFEHVRIAAAATAHVAAAYGTDVAAVRTGNDFPRTTDEETAAADNVETKVVFVGCELSAEAKSDVPANELAAANLTEADRGTTAAIDAGARGITLDGRTAVAVKRDGADATADLPALLSTRDATYVIGNDFKAVKLDGDQDKFVPLTFGFPAQPASQGAAEAVVAKAEAGGKIPEGAVDTLKAAAGFDAVLDKASEAQEESGYSQLRLVRVEQSADDAQPSGVDDGAAADAEQTQAAEPTEGVAAAKGAYARYLAAHAADVVYTSQITTQANGTDLNSAWKALKDDGTGASGIERAYTITSGGTYYLSADLTTENSLVVNAPGKDVTIKFEGRTLTMTGSGSPHQTMVSIMAAKSVTFEGAGGTLKSAGLTDVWGVSSTAEGCMVGASDLTVTLESKSSQQLDLATHAIRMSSGALSLSSCTVQMLMGNQSLRNAGRLNATDSFEVPSAIYAASGVSSVTLDGCTVIGEGPQGFSLDDVNDVASIGNAYAVYSQAASTVVSGGSYKAVSLLGNATCLYGAKLEITGPAVSAEADAGQLATGVLSSAAGSVVLNSAVDFAPGSDYVGYAEAEAALRSTTAGGFVFGDCVPGGGGKYSVLVMASGDTLASANASGYVIGMFSSALGVDRHAAVLAALENAFGTGCFVTLDAMQRPCFAFDDTSAAGAIAQVDSTYYPTLSSALKKFTNGKTLTLLADVGPVAISGVGNGTIDLNGHSIESLDFSTSAAGSGLTVKGGSITGLVEFDGLGAAVHHSSASPLFLEDVRISVSATDVTAYGVYAESEAGALSFSGPAGKSSIDVVETQVSTTGREAYGIYAPRTGPTLVLADTAITVRTASAGVEVCGVRTGGGSTGTGMNSVENCTITARSATGDAGAVKVVGALQISGSSVDVRTSGAASQAFGIQGTWATGSRNPKASAVAIDSCDIVVDAAVDVGDALYSCLLGPTTDSSAPTTAWTLSGENKLVSAGGVHLCKNATTITLAADFKLAAGSDSKLVVSQAQCDGDIGFTVDGTVADSRLTDFRDLFAPMAGSHYDGWVLTSVAADAASGAPAKLQWRAPNNDGGGIVQVTGAGAGTYASLSAALAKAGSGATVKLLADLDESGVQTVNQASLTLDLNGKALTLRSGIKAVPGDGGDGGSLKYTGSGSLTVKGGTLTMQVGASAESATSTLYYQGIAVSGGGTLTLANDAVVNVDYTGGASSTSQKPIAVRGIAVIKGRLVHNGSLNVSGARSDGAIGALDSYGIFVQAASNVTSQVETVATSSVTVDNKVAPARTENEFYADANSGQANAPALREIKPGTGTRFYQDIAAQFLRTATYDDPSNIASNAFGTGIYYAQDMALDRDGAWYDGLRIWAYSDEVASKDVGKKGAIVPAHIFVAEPYDTLPNAYGIASSSSSRGTVSVHAQGAVTATCAHGNAYALDAAGSENATTTWVYTGGASALLAASADNATHIVSAGTFDLRNFIKFSTTQPKKVTYRGAAAAVSARFASPCARSARVGDSVSFSIGGSQTFRTAGLDAAAIEATSFTVGGGFSLSSSSEACSIANSGGANKKGSTFAVGAADASLFADAYGTYVAGVVSGGVAWKTRSGKTVSATFKVGDAVVKRYVNPAGGIDLSEPSGLVARAADARQTYAFKGWSTNPDEYAADGSGLLAADAVVARPSASVTYYAVYDVGTAAVDISFANVMNASGDLVADTPRLTGVEYGTTVGAALAAAGKALPEPANPTIDGMRYQFVGWFPYASTTPTAALLYTSDALRSTDADEGLPVTMALNGVRGGELVLRATYLAAASGSQYFVSFDVDGRVSSCVVDKGKRPVYTASNNGSADYTVPSKSAVGVNYTFDAWLDANSDPRRSYSAVLPAATADAAYIADFSEETAVVELNLYMYATVKGAPSYVKAYSEEARYDAAADSIQKRADAVAAAGTEFGYNGKVYRLDGWTHRSEDREPIYGVSGDDPLPNVTSGNRTTVSSSGTAKYTLTYYGVYTISDHKVDVTFYDGSTRLGSTNVTAANTSINAAFKATGKKTPSDKSDSKSFLGWATNPNAKSAKSGSSTTIESLVGGTDTSLSLYAIYGKLPTYTMNLRDQTDSDESKWSTWSVYVKGGRTLSSAIAGAKAEPKVMPVKVNRYFAGWYTPAGEYFSLDTEITGSGNLFARYNDIALSATDKNISADLKIAPALNAVAGTSELSGITLSLTAKDAAQSLRSAASKDKYTVLKGYSMRLLVKYASGSAVTVDDSFGVAQIKVYVGDTYKSSKIGVYWLGNKDGVQSVLKSTGKAVDDDGYITVNINNYVMGDEDEGGNLAIAYIDGGTNNSLSGGGSGISAGTGDSSSLSSSSLSSSSLGSSSLSASGLSVSGLSVSGLSSPALSASSGGAASSGGSAGALGGGAGDNSANGASEDIDGAPGEDEVTFFSDWDSNAIVLVVLAAIALGAMICGLWRLVVVRQRREESEAELPVLADRYAKGVQF